MEHYSWLVTHIDDVSSDNVGLMKYFMHIINLYGSQF